MRYDEVNDGDLVQPKRRGYKMACCDCGLVHRLDWIIVKYAKGKRVKIRFRAYRDNRATAAMRRGKNIRFKEPR